MEEVGRVEQEGVMEQDAKAATRSGQNAMIRHAASIKKSPSSPRGSMIAMVSKEMSGLRRGSLSSTANRPI